MCQKQSSSRCSPLSCCVDPLRGLDVDLAGALLALFFALENYEQHYIEQYGSIAERFLFCDSYNFGASSLLFRNLSKAFPSKSSIFRYLSPGVSDRICATIYPGYRM